MTGLEAQLDRDPEVIFLQARDARVTYGEADRLIARRARELGEGAGRQVVIRPRLEVESVIEILAVRRSGATAVMISPTLTPALAATRVAAAARDERPCYSIIFTSGSAGVPKGVRLTGSNWAAAARVSIRRLDHGAADRWLCPLPLHHVGGLSILFRSMAAGGTVVLAPAAADLAWWMGRVEFASAVPTQLDRVLRGRTDVFSNRPTILIGGGPAPARLLDRAVTAGMVALPTYGMTETTAQAATAHPGDPDRRLFALPEVELRVGAGDRIQVRGPTVSPGYVGEPDRSPDDWLVTADQGRLESDGSLVVTGRSDRQIISGGENIDPVEVEAALEAHPDVGEAIAIGLPDREWGHIVVVAYTGTATPEQLRLFLLDRLPSHVLPKRWARLEALPRTELGKIDVGAVAVLFEL